MKKRILCLSLVLAMLVSLVACGGKDSKDGYQSNGEKVDKYETPITITTVRTDTNSSVQDYKEGESVENNAWTQLFAEKYGINLEYQWLAANGSDYNTKINLMLSNAELPDYVELKGKDQLQDVVDADLVIPLDELWETYASDLTKQVVAEAGELAMKSCTFNGKMMAIPSTDMSKESANLLYIRQDWLDNLGLEAPKTMQDLLDIAEAFATKDPDKNGKNDTYALGMDKTVSGCIGPIFNANGYYGGNWYYNEAGELTNGVVEDGYKKTLEFLSGWIQKGYIHPEWFTQASSKVDELIINGKVGICFGSFSQPVASLASQHANEPDSDWTVMPCPGWDGNPVTQFADEGVGGYYVISKECEHPEAVILMLNEFVELFYFSDNMDDYYKYINSEEGAHIWQNAHVRAYRSTKNLDVATHVAAYYNGEMKKDDMTSEEIATIEQIDAYKAGDETMWQWNKVFGIDGAAIQIQKLLDADAYTNIITYGTPTMTEITNSTILSDYASEMRISLLTGKKPFSEWDTFIKNYRSMGYDTIKQEIIEKYGLK